jgi:hypothetical protein
MKTAASLCFVFLLLLSRGCCLQKRKKSKFIVFFIHNFPPFWMSTDKVLAVPFAVPFALSPLVYLSFWLLCAAAMVPGQESK